MTERAARVPKVPDRKGIEARVRARWEADGVFAELQRRAAGGTPFSMLDGPITANNAMGVHHARGRTLKDVVQRYHAMNGRDLRWQNGFDCQGLWVEVEVEKALGFNSKRDIEAFGLDRFASACRDRVATYARTISEQSARLGMWMDWDRSYFTMTDSNISYIWGFLAECHRRGWLYRGHQLMPWCHRCGTSLSQHELTDSYVDLVHASVVVRLPLDGSEGEHVAVWTTTPWTLPANVAVAVAPDARYALARSADGDVWVAEDRLADVLPGCPVVRLVSGRDLVGRTFRAPLEHLPAQHGVDHRVIPWAGVARDEGTGLVHVAPGCGAEDFVLAGEHDLAVLSPIDEDGRYVDGFGWLQGCHVTEVDEEILDRLRAEGRLLRVAEITHRYPRCWRCATPLVHRVVDEWFIRCDEVRAPMRAAAAGVQWQPAHMGRRMDDWLANMGDWCISRKRYWGLPLPFYTCESGHLTVVGSKAELLDRGIGDLDSLQELHRPWIDAVMVPCETCGAEARRVPEVGDCWLDAGVVAFSTLGWRNPTWREAGHAEGAGVGLTRADLPDHEYWEKWFPADFVCEMHEQVRLWFYALLFMGVVLDGRAPYRRVLTHGRVNDVTGAEMHKSTGNAISFDDAVAEVGADTMRWMYASQAPSRDLNFGYGLAREVDRRFLTFWNTYAFFSTYARLDGFRPGPRLREHGPDPERLVPMDRWLIARTQQLVGRCRAAIEGLDTPAATAAFEHFADDLSNWYVRLSRERFWRNPKVADKSMAYETLWYALVTATRCIAPIVPFMADELWENLVGDDAPASVHLDAYPTVIEARLDDDLIEAMADVRRVTELGRAARSAARVRRRQPLAELVVVTTDANRRRHLTDLAPLVAAECNVKNVRVVGEADGFVTVEVVPDFSRLGPKFREDAEEIAVMFREGKFTRVDGTYVVGQWEVDSGDVAVRTRATPGFAVAEGDGWVVALDTALTPGLELEGRARDLVREIQELRRRADLAVDDRIDVSYPAAVADVVGGFGAWISEQTLARSLTPGEELAVRA